MRFLLCLVCISFCFRVHTSDTCFVKTLPNGIQEITLPDKKLYILFTPHLGDEPDKIHEIFLENVDSKEALPGDLRVFLNDHKETAEQERRDVSVLFDVLHSKPDIQWIGIESSEKEEEADPWTTQDRIKGYHQIKDFLLKKKVLNPEETENLLHLRLSQEIIALAKYPELFHSKEFFIPLDDNFYKEVSGKVEKIMGHIWQELISDRLLQLFSQVQSKESCQNQKCIENVERELASIPSQMTSVNALVLESDTIVSQEQITAALSEIRDEQIRELLRRFFVYFNQYIEYADERSRTVASLALRQPGNGLITMGSKHQRVVIESLLSSCSP